jgi:hypothetical protein
LPTEPRTGRALRHLRAWPRKAGRSLQRMLGRLPRHTLFVHPDGVWAWAPSAEAAPSRHENIDAWCIAHPGVDARLVVSAHLVHNLLVDAALPLDDDDALHTNAREQLLHYHGTPAQHWPLAVWSDGLQRGACALHTLDLDAVSGIAAAHDVHLCSVIPSWSLTLRMLGRHEPQFAQAGPTALALVEGALTTWLVVHAGAVLQLQQRFADTADAAGLARLLRTLIADSAPLAELPTVIGWGLAGGYDEMALPARVVGDLGDASPNPRWVLDMPPRSPR